MSSNSCNGQTARWSGIAPPLREAIVADGFHSCLWVRPCERWIVSAHPDALVVVLTTRRVLDVVTDIKRVVDGGVQLFVEMSAVVSRRRRPREC